MPNSWKVIWWKDDKKYFKNFDGEKPSASGALSFAKRLQGQGIKPHLVSRQHGFAPPLAKRRAPEAGMLWCPFCLKWRHFKYFAIKVDGLRGPAVWRCPICTISINDYYVRKYNVEMVARLEHRQRDKPPSEKLIRRTLKGQ